MNVAIVTTQDYKTCIVHDEPFEKQVEFAEFNVNNYQIRLAFDKEGKDGLVLEYPVEHEMVQILLDQQKTYLSHVKNGNVEYVIEIPVYFVEKPEG